MNQANCNSNFIVFILSHHVLPHHPTYIKQSRPRKIPKLRYRYALLWSLSKALKFILMSGLVAD